MAAERKRASYQEDEQFNIQALLRKNNDNIDNVARDFIAQIEQPQQIPKEKIAYLTFSRALRNSSEHDVCRLMEKMPDEVKQIARKALMDFQRWGCQIARYRGQKQLEKLATSYTDKKYLSLEDEMKYGEDCFKDAEQALKLCTDQTQPIQDGPLAFLDQVSKLDKEKSAEAKEKKHHGMRIAIEYLMQRHFAQALSRGNRCDSVAMGKGREPGSIAATSLFGYQWAIPLVTEMIRLAQKQSGAIQDLKLNKVENSYSDSYALIYKDRILTKVYLTALNLYQFTEDSWLEDYWDWRDTFNDEKSKWKHGLVKLEEFWPRLEELHDAVMHFQLDKNNYDSLRQFYDNVVETIWLLGNLTPACAGTGKLAEQWLTMAHLKHGLRTPILKLDYPQLDVLDITLPLSVYQKRFFEFFELESLPKPIAKKMLNPLDAEKKQDVEAAAKKESGPRAR